MAIGASTHHPHPIVKPAEIDEEYGQDVATKPELFSPSDRVRFLRLAKDTERRNQHQLDERNGGLPSSPIEPVSPEVGEEC